MNLRRQLARAQRESSAKPVPLTAMIDIVFLLLIFFLFGSFDFAEQQVTAALAGGGSNPTSPKDAVWLQLARPGEGPLEYAIDAGPWTPDAASVGTVLTTRLGVTSPAPALIVDTAAGVTLQDLIDAFALARSAGADHIAIHSRKESP